jgi:hypothetical protein
VLPGSRWAAQIRHFDSPVLRVRYRGGVVVNPYGLPEWDLMARAMVRLPEPEPGLTVDETRVADVLTANEVMTALGDPLWDFTAGDHVARTPPGWAWAHLFGTRDLALVPGEALLAFRHAGGVATMRVDRRRRGLLVDDRRPVPVDPSEQVPEAVLARIEDQLGHPLPPAYRRFLAATNGGTPAVPGVHAGHGFVADQRFFGIATDDRHLDLLYANSWFRDRLTDDFLAIAPMQGGLLATKLRGPDAGSVWYWDDDDPRDDDRLDAAAICDGLLARCADDVEGFLTALSVPPLRLLRVVDARVHGGGAIAIRTPAMGRSLPRNRRPPPGSG